MKHNLFNHTACKHKATATQDGLKTWRKHAYELLGNICIQLHLLDKAGQWFELAGPP